MSIGSFALVKNEAGFIGPHLCAWLPHLDHMVFFAGDSNDDTTQIIQNFQNRHPLGMKITLLKVEPKDLRDDYAHTFNECLQCLSTDMAFYLHPDMFPITGTHTLKYLGTFSCTKGSKKHNAFITHMKSYAGDNLDCLYEIADGRMEPWKNIMRLRSPDLGLHYHGWYGAADEDMYFREITGNAHIHYGKNLDLYPYPVADSGCWIAHFSDVRPFERRLEKMQRSLANQDYNQEAIDKIAPYHPRVTLQNSNGFTFKRVPMPDCYVFAEEQYIEFQKECQPQLVK